MIKIRNFFLLCLLFMMPACTPGFDQAGFQDNLQERTGLKIEQVDADTGLMTKIHRSYPVAIRIEMGNVWGRYGARVAAGELAPKIMGRVGSILTGSYESGVGSVTGSPFDRALSSVIGQPISFFAILKHGKKHASDLDIVSSTSTLKSARVMPRVGGLGRVIGENVYSNDPAFWQRIESSPELKANLTNFRSYYLMVDDHAVSFFFAGSENEYSAMIRAYPSYEDFILAVMNSLADIADRI